MQDIERRLNVALKMNVLVRVADCGKDKSVDTLALAVSENTSDVRRNALLAQDASAFGVVNVMVDICNPVRELYYPALKGIGLFSARVADYSVAHLIGKVESPAAVFNHINNAQTLLIMVKAVFHHSAKRPLSGVAERRMTEIVSEGDSFGQALVERKTDGNGARNLCNLKRMSKACAVMVAVRREEDLRFMLETAERAAMNNPVAVALKGGSDRAFLLRAFSAPGVCAKAGKARKIFPFVFKSTQSYLVHIALPFRINLHIYTLFYAVFPCFSTEFLKISPQRLCTLFFRSFYQKPPRQIFQTSPRVFLG